MSSIKLRVGNATPQDRTKLKRALETRDLSVQELASIVNVTRQTIWNILDGRVRATRRETAQRIEDALRARRGDYFDYGDESAAQGTRRPVADT